MPSLTAGLSELCALSSEFLYADRFVCLAMSVSLMTQDVHSHFIFVVKGILWSVTCRNEAAVTAEYTTCSGEEHVKRSFVGSTVYFNL